MLMKYIKLGKFFLEELIVFLYLFLFLRHFALLFRTDIFCEFNWKMAHK